VAKEVAALTGFKLFHNHLTIDLYKSIFEFGTDHFRRMLEKKQQRCSLCCPTCGIRLV
jgi:hypothetical protein